MAKRETKLEVFSGKAHWAKLNEKNRDFYDEHDKYGSYLMDLELSEEDATALTNRGALVKRFKESGTPFVRLKRPHAIDYDDKDTGEKKTWELGPPEVVDENLEAIDVLIGNGSPVNVEVETSHYGPKGKKMSIRMLKVQVDTRSLIRYEGKGLKKIVTPDNNVVSYNRGAATVGGEVL